MAHPFKDKSWLAAIAEDALRSHEVGVSGHRPVADLAAAHRLDFAAAARIVVARSLRTRRPPLAPVEEKEAFLELVQQDVLLLLDLLLLAPLPLPPAEARSAVAAFFAAALGDEVLALEARHGRTPELRARAVHQAFVSAGRELRARFFPPGDPRHGLPLSSGATAVLRRHLARVVGGFARAGTLEPDALQRHAAYAARELALLAEGLAGLLRTVAPPGRREAWVRRRQMARLGLRGAALREARTRIASPRTPEELALAAPEPMRAFLFEQLLLAQLRARLPDEGAGRFVEAFAQAAKLDPQLVMAAQVEAAAQSGDPQAWFEDFEGGGALDWHELAEDFGEAADKVADRVSTAVTENLGALVTEIRETGELGTLLTRAAAGQRLTAEEKRKIRAQLVDLAKAVPALALFAAPGGSLLLPVLVKLLPFNLLPSAWEKKGTPPPRALPAPASPAEGAQAEPVLAEALPKKPAA